MTVCERPFVLQDPAESDGAPFASILCAVNGSRASAVGVRQATALATMGSQLALLAVVWRVRPRPTDGASLTPARAYHVLADATVVAAAHDVSYERMVEHSPDPTEAIVRHARAHDLLVVGAPALSRASGILRGSVASALVHRAPGPVLLARGALESEAFPARIVVGSDGSIDAQPAIAAAAALARCHHSHVTIVHVTDAHRASARPSLLAEQTAYLHKCLGVEPVVLTASGHAHDVIVGCR
jgi:nucleotide-binding universal stress UspA family protein